MIVAPMVIGITVCGNSQNSTKGYIESKIIQNPDLTEYDQNLSVTFEIRGFNGFDLNGVKQHIYDLPIDYLSQWKEYWQLQKQTYNILIFNYNEKHLWTNAKWMDKHPRRRLYLQGVN